jgi:phospholipase/carboxylesterase
MINSKKIIPIVGIHGWKGNRDSFKMIAELFKIGNAHWIFPQAPYKMKENQYTWAKEIEEGRYEVKESLIYLDTFFKNEVLNKYDSKDVHVLGFSQGATTCYEFVLKMPYQFAGVYPIAGFLRDFESTTPRLNPNQKQTPIFIGHGKSDEIVPVQSSEKIYKILKKETENVEIHLYNGGHKIGMSYIKEAKKRIIEN